MNMLSIQPMERHQPLPDAPGHAGLFFYAETAMFCMDEHVVIIGDEKDTKLDRARGHGQYMISSTDAHKHPIVSCTYGMASSIDNARSRTDVWYGSSMIGFQRMILRVATTGHRWKEWMVIGKIGDASFHIDPDHTVDVSYMMSVIPCQ